MSEEEEQFAILNPKLIESENIFRFNPDCVRKRANFGPSKSSYLFDSVFRAEEKQKQQTGGVSTPNSTARSVSTRSSSSSSSSSRSRKSSSDEDSDEDSDDDDEAKRYYHSLNVAESEKEYMLPYLTPEIIEYYSPKLKALLEKIKEQDERDKKTDKRLYKHFIFTDLKTGPHGAKIIATALQDIFHSPLAYSSEYDSKKEKWSKITMLSDNELQKTPYQNHVLLSSVSVYQQPIPVKTRKEILQRFNQRPDNIYGRNVRFIIMDSGFKEGIDLFDIKYVHVFEQQSTLADLKQVIGRGTRTCGQQGLKFHPTQGWPLHVQIYDATFPEELRFRFFGATTAHELYMKALGIDMRLYNLAMEMEDACKEGAVDSELNRSVHEFSIPPRSRSHSRSRSNSQSGGRPSSSESMESMLLMDATVPATDSLVELLLAESEPPATHEAMQKYVRDKFSQYKWPPVKMENLCEEAPNVPISPSPSKKSPSMIGGSKIIQYTPTQAFVSNYFVPENNRKGMLFWHSVGTGKTCSAIATATHSFEKEGYTILWVTRTTLRNDIWKNMFDLVCHEQIQERIQQNTQIPKEQKDRLKLLSKSWSIRPMSYKQFTNLVSQKNSLYAALVKKNGKEDPLRKTLLIIDEAHKLYGGGDLSSIERPDMKKLQEAIQHSYSHSGKDSVRLILMTATPITTSPLEMVQLVNLFKPSHSHIPDDIDRFSLVYLNQEGRFTPQGRKIFLDHISGHISYLNREKDARVFSQPVIQHVNVPIVTQEQYETYDYAISSKVIQNQQKIERELVNIQKEQIEKTRKQLQGVSQKSFEFLDKKCAPITDARQKKVCNALKRRTAKKIMESVRTRNQIIRDTIKVAMGKIEKLAEKRKDLKEAQETAKLFQAKQERYKNSAFHNIDSTCRESTVANVLEPLDLYKKHQEEIAVYKKHMEQTKKDQQQAMKESRTQFQNARKEIFTQSKNVQDSPQRRNLQEQMKNLILAQKQKEKNQMAQNKKINESMASNFEEVKKNRREYVKETLKNYRSYLKKTAKLKRDEQKQKEKVEKVAKIFQEVAEIQEDELRKEAEKATEEFEEDLHDEIGAIITAEEDKKAEKEQKAAEKKQAQADAKIQKLREKDAQKKEKEAAKEHAKTQKLREKEAQKKEKEAAKEHAKTQKLREKEAQKQAQKDAKAAAKRVK